ncbi:MULTISPECIES: hypothetical protein [unclassified Marinobacter]|uniref:hypothetical protein n=1 Tax=unclassified Marinobacter TaxID=83889 RepID=UPI00126787BF|nr:MULTISPECIES: hypothetical protein [unclassified Marinobacter]QFS87574.1 hypothetical protein FIV08_12145 [Marinobacter sp. THAF197a]QFT51359.1 hypothetical protein FIU96_12060 [Marinobacter sp. THAF39]
MPTYDVSFAALGKNYCEQELRVTADDATHAVEVYKTQLPEVPVNANYYPRKVSEQWMVKEQFALALRAEAEAMGYQLRAIFDGEEWERVLPDMTERAYLKLAMCCDMTSIQFTKDNRKLAFHMIWANEPHESVSDCSNHPDADLIERTVRAKFEA